MTPQYGLSKVSGRELRPEPLYHVVGRRTPHCRPIILRRIKGHERAAQVAMSADLSAWDDIWLSPVPTERKASLEANISRAIQIVKESNDWTVGTAVSAVAAAFDVPTDVLLSRAKQRYATVPRQIAMAIASVIMSYGYWRIGREMGRDHSTAFHAIKKYSSLVEQVRADMRGRS